MRITRPFLAASALFLGALPALAQSTQPSPAPQPSYAPMWRYGHMWGPGPFFHPLFTIFFILLILMMIVALVRMLGRSWGYGRGGYRRGDFARRGGALDILEERFARGEIDVNEFQEKRRLLRS